VGKNLCISSFCIQVALAMCAVGAKGDLDLGLIEGLAKEKK
jgi:hypothetical protein